MVLEAGGCFEPLKWEASELWVEGALSGRGMVGMEEAAVGVACGSGTGQMQLRWEEDQEEEKIQAERKEGALEVGRSLGQVEVGQCQRQAD